MCVKQCMSHSCLFIEEETRAKWKNTTTSTTTPTTAPEKSGKKNEEP